MKQPKNVNDALFDPEDGGKDQGEKASEYTEIEVDEVSPPQVEEEVSDEVLNDLLKEEPVEKDYYTYL